MNKEKDIYLHFISVVLVVFGSLIWGSIGLLGYNPLGRFQFNTNWIYTLIGLAGIYLLIGRDAFLPFLSYGVIPCNVLSISEPLEWDTEVELDAPDGSLVVYWAADGAKYNNIPDAKQAYGNYSNSGVAITQNGIAIARIKHPTKYTVNRFGINSEQNPHIHYRYCMRNNPILSEVFTKELV